MKTAIVLAAVFVSAYAATIPPFPPCTDNAFVCKFKEIGHNIKHHAIGLGDKLASVGTAILDSVISTGTDILLQGSKAVLGTVKDHLADVGKRALVLPQISDIIAKGKEHLLAIGSGLKDKLKATIDKLVGISNKIVNLDITDKLPTDVDSTVADFKGKATSAITLIKDSLKNAFQNIVAKAQSLITGPKRGISDFLANTAKTLQNALASVTDAFRPHIQAVIGQVTDLGNKIKDQASAVVDNVKQSVTDLSAKLTGHVQTLIAHGSNLIQHGKDALGAAKDAIAQIAAQTLGNVKDTVGNAAAVGKDAVGVIVDHVSNGY